MLERKTNNKHNLLLSKAHPDDIARYEKTDDMLEKRVYQYSKITDGITVLSSTVGNNCSSWGEIELTTTKRSYETCHTTVDKYDRAAVGDRCKRGYGESQQKPQAGANNCCQPKSQDEI